MAKRGLFITFEGLEGAGKSTQARRLFYALDLAGFPVILTREPGGTPIGEAVREILIDPKFSEMDPLTETFLFAAARRQHICQVILPQLEKGGIVICDRFLDATVAYQAFGHEIPLNDVDDINSMCAWGAVPDITVYLDIDIDSGFSRVRKRYAENGGAVDRLEMLGPEFFERVSKGYEHVISRSEKRFVVVNANRDADSVSEDVLNALLEPLQKRYPKQCVSLDMLRS
ncbi:dTMP kinase [bacterium]|nr:dTMP kinase [bacterium]